MHRRTPKLLSSAVSKRSGVSCNGALGWLRNRLFGTVCIAWMLLVTGTFWALQRGPYYVWVASREPVLTERVETLKSFLAARRVI